MALRSIWDRLASCHGNLFGLRRCDYPRAGGGWPAAGKVVAVKAVAIVVGVRVSGAVGVVLNSCRQNCGSQIPTIADL